MSKPGLFLIPELPLGLGLNLNPVRSQHPHTCTLSFLPDSGTTSPIQSP